MTNYSTSLATIRKHVKKLKHLKQKLTNFSCSNEQVLLLKQVIITIKRVCYVFGWERREYY